MAYTKFPANIRLDEDVLIRANIFALLIRLQDVLIINNILVLAIRLQDVIKTFSRCLQDICKTSCKDVFKTYYQVKLFLVTLFQDVFETYSKHFWDVLIRRLFTGGLPRSHFWEICSQCTKFPRVITVSQVSVFHFTILFSGCLQRGI